MLLKVSLLLAGFLAVTAAAAIQDGSQDARLTVVAASNRFASDLYEVLRHRAGNLIVSPLSVAAVLTLAYMGAGGNTAAEMRTALHLPGNAQRVADGYRALIDSLQSSEKLILRMANKVYADQQFKIKQSFQQTAVNNFRAAAEQADFAGAAEAARLAINGWVEQVTDGKILNLIPPGQLDPNTMMVLVNAVYFRGTWWRSFPAERTQPKTFYVSASESKDVPTMHRSAKIPYCDAVPGMPARAVELPYLGDGNVRMVILLPNDITGLPAVESEMRRMNFSQLSECMTWQEVQLSLPKFVIESTFELNAPLKELGMKNLFEKADFSGITDEKIKVSKAIQKAFVEVNENGTVAAAATEMEFFDYSGPGKTSQFFVNRPFTFYLLSDDNTVLFIGRVRKP